MSNQRPHFHEDRLSQNPIVARSALRHPLPRLYTVHEGKPVAIRLLGSGGVVTLHTYRARDYRCLPFIERRDGWGT